MEEEREQKIQKWEASRAIAQAIVDQYQPTMTNLAEQLFTPATCQEPFAA